MAKVIQLSDELSNKIAAGGGGGADRQNRGDECGKSHPAVR
ncbi:hypothetical protein BSI_18800 [Bacillus inaquosorum KCTC 13429]|uniref:Uncharacterized protein n=1 Tax=Bacillus inaquosorum KCTC 13429 TaxID=1236548 RepID=A0A9W5LIV4_9BACI|nr:hypothetical protein BSI_18800 [Bacillus inaquosorum KCTC 13429]